MQSTRPARSIPRAPGRHALLAGLLVALLALLACGGDGGDTGAPDAQGAARDIVLISVDTLRHDALGYAGAATETPSIDRLAARGRIFTNARAHAVMTTPSHISMLTGLHPDVHGVRDNGGFVLDDTVPTLATLLAGEGFATGGFVGAYPMAAEKGFEHGFEIYDDLRIDAETDEDLLLGLPNPRANVGQRPGDEVVAAALDWWRSETERRRFLFVHVYDPHAPWDPPSPFKERYADPYAAEVAMTDHYLEPLLSEIEETGALVVFTSDHGEAFGEHGEPTHGFFAYESTLRVPLVLAGPKVTPGRDARGVRHVDLLPTVLDGVGLASLVPEGLPGRTLLNPEAEWQETTYFESLSPYYNFGWAPLRGIVEGDYKLIEQPLPELYDLSIDPGETHNLINEQRATARRLLGLLPKNDGFGLDQRSMDEEERARLAALGYLDARGARGQSMADFSEADDLKNAIHSYNRLRDIVAWLHDGRHDDVVEAASQLAETVPDSPLLYTSWVAALIRRGDIEAGIEVIRRAIAKDAASGDLRRQLGISLLQLGRVDEAIEALEQEAARLPSEMTLNVLGHAHIRRGDAGRAEAVWVRATESFPQSPRAFENLSFLRLQLGDAQGAEAQARRALERRESLPGAWNNLGLALLEQQRDAEAVEAWRRALELAPGNVDVLFNHGLIAHELGDKEAARASLERFLQLAGAATADPRVAEARRILGR